MSNGIMTDEQMAEEVRRCPRCQSTDTNAFHRVSKPAQRADGTYAVCARCNVHWQLSPVWIDPDLIAKDFDAALRVSNAILKHTTLVEAPPLIAQLQKGLPPR
jgi:hypothetical protein